MSTTDATTLEHQTVVPAPRARAAGLLSRLSAWHVALAGVMALAGVLDVRALSLNGYANVFYSAGVKSELHSLHNLLFLSSDPGGFISLDKPPLGVWLQVASARVFGLHPLALLLPEAICGMLAVLVMYALLAPRLGRGAGVAGALALAVFPSFVAVSRDNVPDALLILLMLLACWAALRAIDTGSWWALLGAAALCGLAFNTKTLAALLIVPGIAVAYVLCGPRAWPRRVAQLAAAGVVLVAVSGAWIAFVDLTPSSQRPYVGSSTDDTELNLTFAYNGVGRVGGQVGGPGRVPHVVPGPHGTTSAKPSPTTARSMPSGVRAIPVRGHATRPSTFGGPPGVLRMYSLSLGGQDGWMLPLAFAALLAVALTLRSRRDARTAVLLVMGGWMLCEAFVLSFGKGIIHPYYASALAPGVAAMVGAGAVALTELARRRDWRGVILLLAAAGLTVLVQQRLLAREHYLHSWVPILIVAVAACVAFALARPRRAGLALAWAVGVLAVAPAVYSSTVWDVPVDGTFPAAGPHVAAGYGGIGSTPAGLRVNHRLVAYIRSHHPTRRIALFTLASDTAAPLILLGLHASSMAGYSGTDPALTGPALARLVRRREARYVVLGGAYSTRGGNAASHAVARACRDIPSIRWRGYSVAGTGVLTLYDCGHAAAALARG